METDSQPQPTAAIALVAEEYLTPREREILILLAEGLCNRDIAELLGLKEKTVRNRISAILGKIGADNRTQAALWAQKRAANDG